MPLDSRQYHYHYSNKQVPFMTMDKDKTDDTIFSILLQIRKNHNRADVDSIHKQIIKTVDFENITKEFLDDRIHTLITDGKIINKINSNTDSYYANEKDIDTESLNLQSTSPFIPDKSFYTGTTSIPIPSSVKPLISPNETPITTKSTNPSPDHHRPSQNSSNLIHASTDDLHAEMIALKSFVLDQINMLKKKSDEIQTLSNNENKPLINNLIDQIEFLKNELHSKDTIIKNISEIKIITIITKLKNSSHQKTCKIQNIRQ